GLRLLSEILPDHRGDPSCGCGPPDSRRSSASPSCLRRLPRRPRTRRTRPTRRRPTPSCCSCSTRPPRWRSRTPTAPPRIDAARTALHAMIEELAPEQAVGLRVFGGAVHEDRPDAQTCVDSELVVPVGTGNADALSQAVEAYAPLGDTPIAYALQQAAGDLSEAGERTIVLVSDGVETCDPDPCEVARELRAGGLDLVVHTVGLGADDRTRSQLQCIAAAGGGEYFGA